MVRRGPRADSSGVEMSFPFSSPCRQRAFTNAFGFQPFRDLNELAKMLLSFKNDDDAWPGETA